MSPEQLLCEDSFFPHCAIFCMPQNAVIKFQGEVLLSLTSSVSQLWIFTSLSVEKYCIYLSKRFSVVHTHHECVHGFSVSFTDTYLLRAHWVLNNVMTININMELYKNLNFAWTSFPCFTSHGDEIILAMPS